MPKAALYFKLPEEREEFETAQKAYDYKILIEDLDNWLRNMQKYESKKTVNVEEVRNKIRELLG